MAIVTAKRSGRDVRALITDDPDVEALGMADLDIAPGPGARRLDEVSR